MDKYQILGQFGYFSGISQASKKILADICLQKRFNKKDLLFLEGEKGFAIYCCINGRIQLYKTTAEGKNVVIKTIKPGEIFGEVILFESPHYPVSAVALSKGLAFMIPKHQFFCLLERADFRNDFIMLLMKKQRYLANQIKYLTSNDVSRRFFLFLKDNFGISQQIKPDMSKKDVAAAIGTTPETFSRMLLQLKNENLLDWQQRTIIIENSFWKKFAEK